MDVQETPPDNLHSQESTDNAQVIEKSSQTLVVKTEQKELTHREEVVKIVQMAEKDAIKLINEAETHESVKIAVEEARSFGAFWLKFLNDWVFNFASGLAYHLLTAMFPIVIALLIIVGFITGGLNSKDQAELLNHLNSFFPSVLASQDVLAPAMGLIRKDAGFLGFLAIVVAILSGSRLFITIEDFFDIIYHTPARTFLRQNLMAICMLLLFIILIPVMLFGSSISESMGGSQGIEGFFIGLLASWLLFEAIYMFVPNQHISFRNSWMGASVAALALQLYIALFPLYAKHFLGSYTGNAGFAVILLIFFYYFAVILLLGAEVNAYFAENIRGTPTNIAGLVHRATLDADKAKRDELLREKAERQSMKQ